MTTDLFQKRSWDLFLSYSHSNVEQVQPMAKWLSETAGLNVWWDQDGLFGGDRLASGLTRAMEDSRAAVFCVSEDWTNSSWCEDEFNVALQERRSDPRFRIVAMQLDEASVPKFLSNTPVIRAFNFETEAAIAILQGLVSDPAPTVSSRYDVYLARSWHQDEAHCADSVWREMSRRRYRAIGDAPNYPNFGSGDRVRRIIESCGGLVCVLPYRKRNEANGFTSKWVLKEAQIAQSCERPVLLFAEEGVQVSPELVANCVGARVFPAPTGKDDQNLHEAFDLFDGRYSEPIAPAYSFLTGSFKTDRDLLLRLKGMIERVTNMPCVLGERVGAQSAAEAIVGRIRKSEFLIADVSEGNLNSLIESGVARGAGIPLHLVSAVPDSGELRTRFMFRDLEVAWYDSAIEKIGHVHRIARPYRRRVFVSSGT
ncbi:MAG: toll/interleukin-1 receptor domain-containing protein [Pseudomonadota bacterium]